MSSPNNPTQGSIEKTATATYDMFAEKSGIPADRLATGPYCAEMSALMRHNLRGAHPTDLYLYTGRRESHYSLGLRDADDTIIDLTWQQFLPASKRHNPALPRALILPLAAVAAYVTKAGMGRTRKNIWQESEPSHHDWRAFGNLYLLELISRPLSSATMKP